jgi:thiamine pyrophosphokinase
MARLWPVSKSGINARMKTRIVQSVHPVTLVGGGSLQNDDLRELLQLAPYLVAADGGAGAALAQGYVPRAVIGDLDSLTAEMRAQLDPGTVFPIHEQDSTDFDKALRSIDAPLVLGAGFLGGRIDHQLAAFNVLVTRNAPPCILVGEYEIVFHVSGQFEVDLTPGDVVSLFPMAPVTGRSKGLEWPIDGLQLSPMGRVGTSNRAIGRLELQMDGPGLLVILPRSALPGVMQAIVPLG